MYLIRKDRLLTGICQKYKIDKYLGTYEDIFKIEMINCLILFEYLKHYFNFFVTFTTITTS